MNRRKRGNKVPFFQRIVSGKLHMRFRFYSRVVDGRDAIFLKELSHLTRRTEKFLRKDLKKMINKGLWQDARLDEYGTHLLLTKDAKVDSDISTEEKENMAGVEAPLVFYQEMGKRIKEKQIQKIVTDLGVYTVQISSYGREREDIAKFLSYYVPATKKLLLSYESMEKEGIADNATDLKDILNTIRYSFETFAKKLAEGKSMDVDTDILALEDIWRDK